MDRLDTMPELKEIYHFKCEMCGEDIAWNWIGDDYSFLYCSKECIIKHQSIKHNNLMVKHIIKKAYPKTPKEIEIKAEVI